MKNTRKIKILIIISILIICILSLSSNAIAISDISSQATNFIDNGKSHVGTTMNTSLIKEASDTIYNVLLGIGVAAAVIVGAILGIQFMTAGIDQKVEVKKSLFPYIVSCVVIFGAFGIWKLLLTILKGLEI